MSSKSIAFILLLLCVRLVSQTIVKGPYLQVGTPGSMVIRWETSVATDSKVQYGKDVNVLSEEVTSGAVSKTHIVRINGLQSATRYYYSIGHSGGVLQKSDENYFVTSPVKGAGGEYRFWITGDCGNASSNQAAVRDRYLEQTGDRHTDGWLLLGDNAYNSGTDEEYNEKFFNYYQDNIMKHTVLWPAPGNHDYNNGASTETTVPYFSIFSTPTKGEAGGTPSGNPAYYSYDYGNIHFISLDSYGMVNGRKMYDTTGAQAQWLKKDMAANTNEWTIAYWHHPPYTMGSHNSDAESDLAVIRSRFIRILERYNIDMIMCGHSHNYERTRLLRNYYGNEASFDAEVHQLSSSSGAYDGSPNSCPYELLSDRVHGTMYTVSGSAGQVGGTQASYPHEAMHYSNAEVGGSLVLTVKQNRLDMQWLCADGIVRDKFTIVKDAGMMRKIFTTSEARETLTASWPGSYKWNTGETSRSIEVVPGANTVFWVEDPYSCLRDSFIVDVTGVERIFPNPSAGQFDVVYTRTGSALMSIYSAAGQLVHRQRIERGTTNFNLPLSPGVYQVLVDDERKGRKLGRLLILQRS